MLSECGANWRGEMEPRATKRADAAKREPVLKPPVLRIASGSEEPTLPLAPEAVGRPLVVHFQEESQAPWGGHDPPAPKGFLALRGVACRPFLGIGLPCPFLSGGPPLQVPGLLSFVTQPSEEILALPGLVPSRAPSG